MRKPIRAMRITPIGMLTPRAIGMLEFGDGGGGIAVAVAVTAVIVAVEETLEVVVAGVMSVMLKVSLKEEAGPENSVAWRKNVEESASLA